MSSLRIFRRLAPVTLLATAAACAHFARPEQVYLDRVAAPGALPRELDAAQLVLFEILTVLGPMLVPQLVRLVTGTAVTDPEFHAKRAEFLVALTRRLDGAAAGAPVS